MKRNLHSSLVATLCLSFLLAATLAGAADRFTDHIDPRVYAAPRVWPEPAMDKGEVKAIFYEGLPYQGKPTRVFAYVGVPKRGGKVPGMVLLHGGGGTAFDAWVRIWMERGYAAIAMDLEGHTAQGRDGGAHPGHAWSGPARSGFFADTSAMLTDQWGTHALSDVMLAQSLLAATEGVDGGRIGVTGISWGGVLTSAVMGIDQRFKCAVPVYGCGFLYDSKSAFKGMRVADAAEFEKRAFWDPARYCVDATMPTLWVNGDRDPHFSLDIFSRSAAAVTKAPATLCIHPAMHHSHPPGYNPKEVPEIYAFADSVLKGGEPLTKIARQPEGREAVVGYEGARPVVRAEAYYLTGALEYIPGATPRAGLQLKDPWKKVEGVVHAEAKTVTARMPEGATMYYLNLIDDRGCVVSSRLVEIGK